MALKEEHCLPDELVLEDGTCVGDDMSSASSIVDWNLGSVHNSHNLPLDAQGDPAEWQKPPVD